MPRGPPSATAPPAASPWRITAARVHSNVEAEERRRSRYHPPLSRTAPVASTPSAPGGGASVAICPHCRVRVLRRWRAVAEAIKPAEECHRRDGEWGVSGLWWKRVRSHGARAMAGMAERGREGAERRSSDRKTRSLRPAPADWRGVAASRHHSSPLAAPQAPCRRPHTHARLVRERGPVEQLPCVLGHLHR